MWLPHSVHHYITQLNINKGAVGNPVELFLIGLGISDLFDFLPCPPCSPAPPAWRSAAIQHINVRFNSPRWWRFLFNTANITACTRGIGSATRSNYSNSWIFIDRIFGTCIDGEARDC